MLATTAVKTPAAAQGSPRAADRSLQFGGDGYAAGAPRFRPEGGVRFPRSSCSAFSPYAPMLPIRTRILASLALMLAARSECWIVAKQPPSGNPRAGGSDRSSDAVALQCSLADCRLLNHASRGVMLGLAAAVGNQSQAMLVLALRVRKHRALCDLHRPRGRSESNGFLTRAVEGDGMRVR